MADQQKSERNGRNRSPRSLLIVAGDTGAACRMARRCGPIGYVALVGASTEAALSALGKGRYAVVVVDLQLPDATVDAVLAAARELQVFPTIIVTGEVSTGRALRIAQQGVAGFIAALDATLLGKAIHAAANDPPDLRVTVARMVGLVTLPRALDAAREAYYRQALGMAEGNRRQAGRLLGVHRQAVQNAIRENPSWGAQGAQADDHE